MRLGRLALIVAAVVLAAVPAIAAAHRAPTARERRAIVAGFDRSADDRIPERCFTVEISTPETSWAQIYWTFHHGQPLRGCEEAGNGTTIMHRRGGRWRFVYAGDNISAAHCSAPHVPRRVLRDLGLCR